MFYPYKKSVVLTENYDVIINKEELTVTTEYLTLQTRPTCRVDRYCLTESTVYVTDDEARSEDADVNLPA